jgi:transcriptional regulator with XRE-family HTH domain
MKETREEEKKEVQKKIDSLMKKHRLSLEAIASKLNISAMTVYRWHRGKVAPRSRIIKDALDRLTKSYA